MIRSLTWIFGMIVFRIREWRRMTAQEVKKLLHLEAHPREGGWFVQTYAAKESVPADSFEDGRYGSPRRTSTAIYYLLEPGTFSEMHCLKSDEGVSFLRG